jgi:FkbM family methyltransferase
MDEPTVTQRHVRAKRVLLAPLARPVHSWALTSPRTPLKAKAMRWLVLPGVVASAKPFVRDVDSGFAFGGTTRDLLDLYVYLFGVWEPNLTAFVTNRLEPGSTFVDVGANCGWFTLLAASRVGPTGHVVAVEASPLIAEKLRGNIERNGFGNVRVAVAAVGSGPGEVVIVHGPAEHTALTKVQAGTAVVAGEYTVACDTLPALLSGDELSRARVVKIDVEGAEFDVVSGLEPALGRFSPTCEFVVEVGPRRAGSVSEAAALMAAFRDAGYSAYEMPNSYEVDSYVLDNVATHLERIEGTPEVQTDVVFARVDAPRLAI